jgi:integrase
LPDITTDDIAAMIGRLRAQGLAPKTINGSLVPLGRIFAHALRRGYITDNPLRRLEQHERPRIQKRDQRVLDHDEIARPLDASLPRYRPLLAMAIYTGMRHSELLGLTWADLDLETGLIHVRYQLSRARLHNPARRVRLKTNAAARDIPLLPQLNALLKRHKLASRHSAHNDSVFTTAEGGPLYCGNAEKRGLRRAANNAGLNTEGSPQTGGVSQGPGTGPRSSAERERWIAFVGN